MHDSPVQRTMFAIQQCMLALLDGGGRCTINEDPRYPEIRFQVNGMWFKLTEVSGQEASWTVRPCNHAGHVEDRPGFPVDMCESVHPGVCPYEVATFAVMVAVRWKLPKHLDNSAYKREFAGTYYH